MHAARHLTVPGMGTRDSLGCLRAAVVHLVRVLMACLLMLVCVLLT